MAEDNTSTTLFSELCQQVDPTPEVVPTYRFSDGRTFYEPGREPGNDGE